MRWITCIASAIAASESSPGHWSARSRDRLRGATARAKKAGGERDFIVMNGDFSIESGALAAERLLGRKDAPTAIFCFNDEMAMGVIDTARRRKLRIPDDLSLVGFDDIRFARYMDPPLTTVAQPMRQIGEGTVRLLLDIVQGRRAPESTRAHTSLCGPAPRAGRPSMMIADRGFMIRC